MAINWKRIAKIEWKESVNLNKQLDYEFCIINELSKEFEKEDRTGHFNTDNIRNMTALYAMYLHGNDATVWVPSFRNNATLWKAKQDISKILNKILYPHRKQQTMINIGFIVLAFHFIYTMM